MDKQEIDELIATKIMGWHKHTLEKFDLTVWLDDEDVGHSFVGDFKPSKDIEDAWEALDKVCNQHNWRAIIDRNNNETEVNFKNQMGAHLQHYGIAETVTMAICLATLETVGVKLIE